MPTINSGFSESITVLVGEEIRVEVVGSCDVTIDGVTSSITTTQDYGKYTIEKLIVISNVKGRVQWDRVSDIKNNYLTLAQQANTNIKGAAGADLNGGIYDAAGNKISTGGKAKRDAIYTWKMGTGATNTALTAGRTSCSQIPFDKPYYAVRIAFINYSTSASYAVDIAKVASSPTSLNNGSALTWVQVLFGGAATTTVPQATGSGNNIIPGIVMSDIVYIKSVERTDTPGAPYLLQLRNYTTGVTNVTGGPISTANGSAPYFGDRGYIFGWGQGVGDVVTTISAVSLSSTSALSSTGHIEFFTGNDAASMLAFGDSLLAGYSGNASGYQSSWPAMLDYQFRQAGIQVGVGNYAVGGMNQTAFIQTMKNVVTLSKPSIVYIPSFSPNDATSTQAGWDTQYARTLEAINWLIRQGVTPCTATAAPLDGFNTAQNGYRVTHNSRVLNELSKVCKVFDINSVIEDPSNPGKTLPAYYYDGTHQNDAGQQAIANLIQSNWTF